MSLLDRLKGSNTHTSGVKANQSDTLVHTHNRVQQEGQVKTTLNLTHDQFQELQALVKNNPGRVSQEVMAALAQMQSMNLGVEMSVKVPVNVDNHVSVAVIEDPNRPPLKNIEGRVQIGCFEPGRPVNGQNQLAGGGDPLFVELKQFEIGLPLEMAIDLPGREPQWIRVPFDAKADGSGNFRFLVGEPHLSALRRLGLNDDSMLVFRQHSSDGRPSTESRIPINTHGTRTTFGSVDELAGMPSVGDTGLSQLLKNPGATNVVLDSTKASNVTSRGKFEPLNLSGFRFDGFIGGLYEQMDPDTANRSLYVNIDAEMSNGNVNQFTQEVAPFVRIQDVQTSQSADGHDYNVVITLGKGQKAAGMEKLAPNDVVRQMRGEVAIGDLSAYDIESKRVSLIVKDNTGHVLFSGVFRPPENGIYRGNASWGISGRGQIMDITGGKLGWGR